MRVDEQIVQCAADLARNMHIGHVRKYSGVPYFVHLQAVAYQVRQWSGDTDMICAALLHDVLEDTVMSAKRLEQLMGQHITRLVVELTDVFTRASFPQMARAERKKREAERIASCSLRACVVKLADLKDNTLDILRYPEAADFSVVYLAEKAHLEHLLDGVLDRWLNVAKERQS
jgi:(p)ppGpp synthase/HD superfamily hydrolase